jgi:hypothetical protein
MLTESVRHIEGKNKEREDRNTFDRKRDTRYEMKTLVAAKKKTNYIHASSSLVSDILRPENIASCMNSDEFDEVLFTHEGVWTKDTRKEKQPHRTGR